MTAAAQVIQALVWLAFLCVLLACGQSGSSASQSREAVSPSLESIQRNLVGPSCVGCHTIATPQNRNVSLTDLNTVIDGKNHVAGGAHTRALIKPGCPNQSQFLGIMKEGKMPPPGKGSVTAAELETVAQWIQSLKPGANCNSDEPVDQKKPGSDEPGGN